MFVFSYCIALLFNSSKSKVFVTFFTPFSITLKCQIYGNSCLLLGLKLVHWLFTEKIASYDLPSCWRHVGIMSLKPQWIPGEKNHNKWQRGFSACLSAWWHLYAYKQASHALKLKEWCSINKTTQITEGHLFIYFLNICTFYTCTAH